DARLQDPAEDDPGGAFREGRVLGNPSRKLQRPYPGGNRLLDLLPIHLPNHPGHSFSVRVIEVGQGIEEMAGLLDAEFLAIPLQHVRERKAVAAEGEEVDEILLRAPLCDGGELHAGQIAESGEAAAEVPPSHQGIEHPVAEFEEADAYAVHGAVQRAGADLPRDKGNSVVPDLLGETEGVGNAVSAKPVEVHGAAMTQVQGDRGSTGEVEAVSRRLRTEEPQGFPLSLGQNLAMEAHGRVRRSQTCRRSLFSHSSTRRRGMSSMSCQ